MKKLEIFYHMFLNPKKTQILGSIISRALYDDNPIKFINKSIKRFTKG